MAVFKSLISNDIKNTKSVLNQLVDIVREDVSGSNSRKSYEVFVTSSVGPGVTSSLYQTVFDQDFSLQTANSMFDITFGFSPETDFVNQNATARNGKNPGIYVAGDTAKKKRYTQTSLMIREKVSVYKQFAATLRGSADVPFFRSIGSTAASDRIDAAIFLSFHRLFVRDGIKRETFAMRMKHGLSPIDNGTNFIDNLFRTQGINERIYTDFGSTTRRPTDFGGNVGELVRADNTAEKVGLIYYDHGTVVLDAEKVFSPTDIGQGVIDAMTDTTSNSAAAKSVHNSSNSIPRGKTLFGPNGQDAQNRPQFQDANGTALNGGFTGIDNGGRIYPYFFTSGSIDDIVDHICNTRFGSDAGTAITFQNKTEINSTIYFIRAAPDEFNYSSNPTYTDQQGSIVVTDASVNALEKPFSYITTVGLYGDFDDLLAVAKLSRPVEKNDEKDLTIRVRLDF